jgi:hypothetical protein
VGKAHPTAEIHQSPLKGEGRTRGLKGREKDIRGSREEEKI